MDVLQRAIVCEQGLCDTDGAPAQGRQGVTPLHDKYGPCLSGGRAAGVEEGELVACGRDGDGEGAGERWVQIASPFEQIDQTIMIEIKLIGSVA